MQLGSATVTIRNEWAVWILSFITLNVYGIIWWYQVNRELRDVAREADVRVAAAPAVSAVLMALWPLGLIPPLVTVFITSGRLRLLQRAVGADDRVNPIIATVLFPLLLLHSVYLQKKLNSTWQHTRARA